MVVDRFGHQPLTRLSMHRRCFLSLVAIVAIAACSTIEHEPDARTALERVGLDAAAGIELTGPAQLAWSPQGIMVRGLRLANTTGQSQRFPFDLTLLHWRGDTWHLLPCQDLDNATDGLCATTHENTQVLGPNEAIGADDPRLIFLTITSEPSPKGTYALVIPLWPLDEDVPDQRPMAGVALVVSID